VEIGIAAITHDVGKIRLPEGLMTKPGSLTEEEWVLMRQHPFWGAQVLGNASFYIMAATVAEHHHERWDGSGYPHGLKGQAIPLAARIVGLAAVYDALTTERPYKAAWPAHQAHDYILEQRATQFDPAVVDAFTAAWREGTILRIQSRISL
jgi:HD-GYP domain-containing protein (c-di-GMP phosphodiesterase class II)